MSSRKKYGVGLVGAGWLAGEYVKAFRDHPFTYIAGIYSRTSGKAARLLAQHGVEAREYASLDELLDDDRIAIVASCTQPNARAEHCVRAAQTGRLGRWTQRHRSFGYDIRVADEFRIFTAATGRLTVVDPKAIDESAMSPCRPNPHQERRPYPSPTGGR